jgi:pimeloyl-ACP methyl ester carboxylesterase
MRVTGRRGEVPAWKERPMESRRVTVNGIGMRWEESGEGRPVVFVHGIPTSPRLWRHVIPRVRGARCMAWEMVGYGASIEEGRGRDISVARQAEYLAAWMRAVELDEGALIVGHDLGGGVAQILAARHRELVRGLVLTNAVCYDSWPIPHARAMRAMGFAVRRVPAPVFRFVYGAFLLRSHDDRRLAREALDEHWPYYERSGGAAAMVRQARSLHAGDTLAVADRIPGLDLPACVVWGAADPFQKIGYGYRLAVELGAPLDRVEGGGHFVPEDHPERVAAAVNDLVR